MISETTRSSLLTKWRRSFLLMTILAGGLSFLIGLGMLLRSHNQSGLCEMRIDELGVLESLQELNRSKVRLMSCAEQKELVRRLEPLSSQQRNSQFNEIFNAASAAAYASEAARQRDTNSSEGAVSRAGCQVDAACIYAVRSVPLHPATLGEAIDARSAVDQACRDYQECLKREVGE
jgi:hypothetical protein